MVRGPRRALREPQNCRPCSPRQNIIAEHEIRNISCAAQDPEDLCTFAYITKDLQTSHHYCHVFSTVDVVGRTPPLGTAGEGLGGDGLRAVLSRPLAGTY